MTSHRKNNIEFEHSSGNAFADLGLHDAEKLLSRSKIGFHVYKLVMKRKLKQTVIAELLGINKTDMSHLMNGHFNQFTDAQLLDFQRRLNGFPLES